MKKALVTGGAGFMGYHLGRHLVHWGYHVYLVDNLSRGVTDSFLKELESEPNVSFEDIDLLNPAALEHLDDKFTHIFHMAAIIGVQNVLDRPYWVLRDNIGMMTRVLDFATRQQKLERFLFPSTSEVYAGTLKYFELPIPTPENTPLTLTDLDHPRTSYMLSKIYGEAMCHHVGLPFTIIRPHNVYGPRMGMAHVIPELLYKAHKTEEGGSLEVFSVNHKRSFCYINDAIELIIRLVESNAGLNNSFNIGSETEEIRVGELAEIVIDVVGKSLTVAPLKETPGSPTRRCPDMQKTIAAASYTPSVSVREGVAKTFDWYRTHIFDGRQICAS